MKLRLPKFKSVVALANSEFSVKASAVILASSTLVSAVLGLVRDRLLNSLYLDTYPTGIDAYTAAFTIPDFMFFVLTSGALAVSFIPVFNQRLVAGNKKSAWELSSSTLNFLALLTLIASVLIMIFAEPLIRYVVGPGLDEEGMALAINMTRVIAINPFLFSIATVLTSMQQAVSRFLFYALAPALYNIGILIGITCFTGGIELFGVKIFDGGIMGVALGVVLGAVLQVLVSLIGMIGLGFDYEFKINWKNQGFRTVLRMLPPRSLSQMASNVNDIVTTNLSSRMGSGALRTYQQAATLHRMPMNLIGVAIATAYFPKLTEDEARGNRADFRRTFRRALRMIIWIILPVAVIAFFARGYVVSFIKNGGDAGIASVLGTLAVAIVAHSIYHLATRGFFAKQDTKTPFFVSVASIVLTIGLSVLFTLIGCGPEGLGWAASIGACFEVAVLLWLLNRRLKGQLFDDVFRKAVARMGFCALIVACVSYSLTKLFPLMATDDSILLTAPKFALIVIVSFGAYLIAGYFCGLEEVQSVTASARAKICRFLPQKWQKSVKNHRFCTEIPNFWPFSRKNGKKDGENGNFSTKNLQNDEKSAKNGIFSAKKAENSEETAKNDVFSTKIGKNDAKTAKNDKRLIKNSKIPAETTENGKKTAKNGGKTAKNADLTPKTTDFNEKITKTAAEGPSKTPAEQLNKPKGRNHNQ